MVSGATLIETGGGMSDIVWEDFKRPPFQPRTRFPLLSHGISTKPPLRAPHIELFSRYFAALAEIDGPARRSLRRAERP